VEAEVKRKNLGLGLGHVPNPVPDLVLDKVREVKNELVVDLLQELLQKNELKGMKRIKVLVK
jgi:hypothetical protein